MTKEDELASYMDEISEKHSDGAGSHGKGMFRENPEHVPVEVLQQQGVTSSLDGVHHRQ